MLGDGPRSAAPAPLAETPTPDPALTREQIAEIVDRACRKVCPSSPDPGGCWCFPEAPDLVTWTPDGLLVVGWIADVRAQATCDVRWNPARGEGRLRRAATR